ncbi:MAG: hypothetical protein OXC14_17830 [Rhodospirillaceae bacterium]|nr:hypothetical protein [Rhodospirillaceae bacterium]
MSEQNVPSELGEKIHRWIAIISIGGVALLTLVLALIGGIAPAV